MFKGVLTGMFLSANEHNKQNILNLAKRSKGGSFLDLGCDEGTWTLQVAASAQASRVAGIELNAQAAGLAQQKGVEVRVGDLMDVLPYQENSFDLVHANQVIEHVPNIDHFASEAFRVLKPGGHLIVSTENGSSWHNILAAIMGWQIFSLTNLSSVQSGIGNPLALHRGSKDFATTWTHKVIFNYQGLKEFLQLHGFKDLSISGAGYYPFPTSFGALDPRHAHFITVSAVKPKV